MSVGYDYPAQSPQPQPYKCLVCDGTGLVSRPPNIAGDQQTWVDNNAGPYNCRVCSGLGVLWR